MKSKLSASVPVLEAGRIVDIPVPMLMPDPKQPRIEFPEDDLEELGDDMLARGVDVPLIVRSDYVIVDGERRWRAAQRKKMATLPCLLARPADEKKPDLERLLGQAAVNDRRAPLSVFDWANLLQRLVAEHGVAVKDLPDLLEARGFKKLSRPYISNLMRMNDLPEWARDAIRAGHFNASDGKYLLMLKPWPKAEAWVERYVAQELKDMKEGQTLRLRMMNDGYPNVEELVEQGYHETALILSRSWHRDAPRFNWKKECQACPKRHEVAKEHFCLDKKCFDEKQSKAPTEAEKVREFAKKPKAKPKPTGPTPVKPDENGVVSVAKLKREKYHHLQGYGVRFEPTVECVGCEHNHPAARYKGETPEPTCFNPACYATKQRNGSRTEGVALWLDARLFPAVESRLTGNYDLQFQLLAWMALGAPTSTKDHNDTHRELGTQTYRAAKELQLRDPGAVIRAYEGGDLKGEAIARAGLAALRNDRAHFYAFARHLGIELTPALAGVDDEYLALKRKPELLALFDPHVNDEDREALPKYKLEALLEFGTHEVIRQAIGVPPDVRALYERLEPVLDHDFFDPEDDDEDDVSGETEDDDEAGEDTPVEADA